MRATCRQRLVLVLHRVIEHGVRIGRWLSAAGVSLSLADLQAWKLGEIAATLRLMDDHAAQLGATWKGAWREFLRVGNVLQFAPGT